MKRAARSLGAVAGSDTKAIDHAITSRIPYDWVTDRGDEKWRGLDSLDQDARNLHIEVARQEMAENDQIIKDARSRILRRFVRWQKAGLHILNINGYKVKVSKPRWHDRASYISATFSQDVDVNHQGRGVRVTITVNLQGVLELSWPNRRSWRSDRDSGMDFARIVSAVI